MSNPLEQFVIKPIIPLKAGDVDISFTNSSLFMLLAVARRRFCFRFVCGGAPSFPDWRSRCPNALTVLSPI